jgi:hypothetical protein
VLTRDSWILTLTILGAVLGVILAQFDVLPASWQPYKGALTILSSVVGVIAGILRTSPLAGVRTPTAETKPGLMGLVKLSDKG